MVSGSITIGDRIAGVAMWRVSRPLAAPLVCRLLQAYCALKNPIVLVAPRPNTPLKAACESEGNGRKMLDILQRIVQHVMQISRIEFRLVAFYVVRDP